MAEWFVEEGIGEHRAIRLDGATIAEALVQWPGGLTAGLVEEATLVSRVSGSSRGTARFDNGRIALVDRLPRDAAEGARIRLQITRPALAEAGRAKHAQARPTDAPIRPAPSLAEGLEAGHHAVRRVRRFPECDWDELVSEALDGRIAFPGGALNFACTPAMTVCDVDGDLAPSELALAAAKAFGTAIRRLDLRGNIGVDFPTLPGKEDRRAVDSALATALVKWPHERTAMNGFGFVQLVARLERPSLLHRAAYNRAGFAARQLLRRAEGLEGAGVIELTAHPSVLERLSEEWLAELRRCTGREVTTRQDNTLAMEAPHAQLVER
ncbi:ribonuclease [Aurantiacibacter poecillastricola]|uniref:ribonuclease n=1 Tax=Aurantiacibacter poecillastricola TaxID=3064385 RepID=UPI00273D3659|nr:ribonuclease [Aurantiacibacter sp. 219JJ12-13]MDP5262494.1 ribonuclease [Aurantiacibacter sp. 219JJ12-13]